MGLNTANQMLLIPDGSLNVFDANRNRYALFVTISDPSSGHTLNLPLTGTESVEWFNEVNRLCLTGSIVVNDVNGRIGNIVGSHNLRCDISFSRLQPSKSELKTRDAKFGPVLAKLETMNPEETFHHSFLVTNIEILGKIDQIIKYKIHLVSINYIGCTRQINYTNYGKDHGEDIFDIVKALMVPAFNNIENPEVYQLITGSMKESGVELYWCTRPGETIISAIPRLFTKLFFSEKIQLNGGGDRTEITSQRAKVLNPSSFSIPYIVTLPKIDKICDPGYKLIDFSTQFATDRHASGGTVIFLDGAGLEALARKNAQRLGTITTTQLTKILSIFRPYKYMFYDYQGFTDALFTEIGDIVGLWLDKSNLSETNKDKFDAKSIEDMFALGVSTGGMKTLAHAMTYGESNTNGLHIYSDLVTLFLYGDSIVFEKDGNLADLPGNNIVLGDETSIAMRSEAKDAADWESKLKSNNQFIGEYNIVKTHHIINPNEKTFTETLVLARKRKHAWTR